MRVLITEYVLSTYHKDDTLIYLMPEAFTMVEFLAYSLIMNGAYVGITMSSLINSSLLSILPGSIIVIDPHNYFDEISRLNKNFDYVIVIAPPKELVEIIDLFDDEMLLQPSRKLIKLFSSKYTIVKELGKCGFKVPETKIIDLKHEHSSISGTNFPIIVKPTYSAGSECVYLVNSDNELRQALLNTINCDPYGMVVLQDFINGVHGSISVVYGVNGPLFYSLNLQLIKNINGSLRFIGGILPIRKEEILNDVERIIHGLFTCYPELRGYVGLDVVWNNEGVCIIEVNPRPTTSIAGIVSLYPGFGKYMLSIHDRNMTQTAFLGDLINGYAYYVSYNNEVADSLGMNEGVDKEIISIFQRTVEVGKTSNLINIYQRIKPLLNNLVYDINDVLR